MLQQHLPNIVLLQDYYRLKDKGEPLVGDKKDEVEYKEPMQEFVDDFKLKTKDNNEDTELKEV